MRASASKRSGGLTGADAGAPAGTPAGACTAGASAAAGAASSRGGAGGSGAAPTFGAAACSAAPPSPTSMMATSEPSDSVSPTFTFSSRTTPANGDGTSIVALSDSSVTRPWSFATVSPGATSTSITGTSSKPPMSGTFTSTVLAIERAVQQRPAHVAEQLRQVGGDARRGGADDYPV